MSTQKVTSHLIDSLSSNKLTGALPALNGSALTGVSAITKSTTDPAITTNPSAGVGALWANTNAGTVWACTDATTDNNVWKNIGLGSGDVAPYSWQGTVEFYMVGGVAGNVRENTMDKVTFASDGVSVNIGDFGATTSTCSGSHSATAGYSAAGQLDSVNTADIKYFNFATATTTVDHGSLNDGNGHRRAAAGYSDGSYGYLAGGYSGTPPVAWITRYQYAAANQAADLGDLDDARKPATGCQTGDHAYVVGGEGASPATRISRFNFASSITLEQHGDLASASGHGDNSGGASSTTHGYVGGHSSTVHQKFSFASENTTATLTNCTAQHTHCHGAGSTTHGYYVGGAPSTSTIDRFQFGSDNDMNAVANLSQGRYGGTTHNN